jgi:predicted PurR-regulated permease PerM
MSSNLAAALCVLVAVVLVVVPMGLVIIGMVNEAGDAVSQSGITHYITLIASHPLLHGFNLNATTLQKQFNQYVSDTATSILQSVPNLTVGLIITLIGMFYILLSWKTLSEQLKKHIPSTNKERIIKELDKTTHAILYGTLVMAVLEFGVAYVGFSLAGVGASLIIAALIFVLAFIPVIDTILVWVPLALYYFSTQNYVVALGVVLVGIVLTVGIETLLYAKWIGDRTSIHPFVMMVGVIGGVSLFGIFGFIFGPLILASAMEVVRGAMQSDERIPEQGILNEKKSGKRFPTKKRIYCLGFLDQADHNQDDGDNQQDVDHETETWDTDKS